MNVPDAPTFRPTKEEWSNPLTYIQSIRAQAQLYGICKIIPPDGWRPTVTGLDKLRFVTKKQRIDLLQWRDFDAAKVEFYTRLVLFWQHEWRRHVQQQKRKRPTSTSASTTSASAAAPSPDERNFTFSGVKLVDGEIVNPRLTSCTLSGDLDVDLFLLYELVRTQWGGYTAVGKANGWSEVVKKMRTAALICHTNHVFQRNDENPFTWQQGQSQSSGRGRGRQQARQESPISAPDDMSTGTLTAAAKELAKVYKTYLLPYEHYERSFIQQCQQHMGDIATDATATSTNSAASSPASSSAAIASSTSPSPPPPASSSMHPPSVPWTNSKRPVHLLTPGAPHPYLSVNELNKWQNINHVHQLQSKRADTPMNDDESTPTEASIDEESKMCQKCTMRLDDLSSVCYACRKGYHWNCLSPPLQSSPLPPWYCPACLAAVGPFRTGGTYDFASYEAQAEQFKHDWFAQRQPKRSLSSCPYAASQPSPKHSTPSGACICPIRSSDILSHYWSIVEGGQHDPPVEVVYGSDIGGDGEHGCSAFPTKGPYARADWNLNNLRRNPETIVKHQHSGVTIPWLYVGMMFSSFCWHAEDHYMYSINYNHHGAIKQWYGIPAHAATAFECVARRTLPHLFANQPDLLYHIDTMLSPAKIQSAGVPVYNLQQHAGEFVVTFPQAYHAGFNYGVNIAEAVNFTPIDWIPFGMRCIERYRCFHRSQIFSTEQCIMQLARDPMLDGRAACWLLPCMLHIRDEEVVLREHLRAYGVMKATPWALHARDHPTDQTGADAATSGTSNMRSMMKHRNRHSASDDQCFYCLHMMHISAVWCACSPQRLACLRHASSLCQCPPSEQTLFMRYTIDELDMTIRSVKGKAREYCMKSDDPIQSGEEILAECCENLNHGEIPRFCPTPDTDDPKSFHPSTMPDFSDLVEPSNRKKTKYSKHAPAHAVALQRTQAFMMKQQELDEKQQSDHQLMLSSSHQPLSSSPSSAFPPSAVSLLHSVLSAVPVVSIPLQRHELPSPSIASVRMNVRDRADLWLSKVGPYLLAERELRKQPRDANRQNGQEENDDSSADDDNDDDDDDDDESEGEQSDESQSESEDLVREGALKRKRAQSSTRRRMRYVDVSQQWNDTVQKLWEPNERVEKELRHLLQSEVMKSSSGASRPKRKKVSVTPISNQPIPAPILSLSELCELLSEGRSLIWSSVHSTAINLVFLKLKQWHELATKLTELTEQCPSHSTSQTKQELSALRQMMDVAPCIPINFSSSPAAVSPSLSFRTRAEAVAAQFPQLKQQVNEGQMIENELESLFEPSDWSSVSIPERDTHPAFRTVEQLLALQARANRLCFTFPHARRLLTFNVDALSLLHRCGVMLGTAAPRPYSAEDLLQLDQANPRINEAQPSPSHVPTEVSEASSLLADLLKLPVRHPVISRLHAAVDSTQRQDVAIRRMLFFSPAMSLRRDRHAFVSEEDMESERKKRTAQGDDLHLIQLSELIVASSDSPPGQSCLLIPSEMKRVNKVLSEMEEWQQKAREELGGFLQRMKGMDEAVTLAAVMVTFLCIFSSHEPAFHSLDAALRDLGVHGASEYAPLSHLVKFHKLCTAFHRMIIQPLKQSHPQPIASSSSSSSSSSVLSITQPAHSNHFDFSQFQPRQWLHILQTEFTRSHRTPIPTQAVTVHATTSAVRTTDATDASASLSRRDSENMSDGNSDNDVQSHYTSTPVRQKRRHTHDGADNGCMSDRKRAKTEQMRPNHGAVGSDHACVALRQLRELERELGDAIPPTRCQSKMESDLEPSGLWRSVTSLCDNLTPRMRDELTALFSLIDETQKHLTLINRTVGLDATSLVQDEDATMRDDDMNDGAQNRDQHSDDGVASASASGMAIGPLSNRYNLYSITQVEHLYELSTFLQRMDIALPIDVLRRIYSNISHFKLAAESLLHAPYLPAHQLLPNEDTPSITESDFKEMVAKRSAALEHFDNQWSFIHYLKGSRTGTATANGSSDSTFSFAKVNELTVNGYFQQVAGCSEDVVAFDINWEAWCAFLHADLRKHGNKEQRTGATDALGWQYRMFGFDPTHHPLYVALGERYASLVQWAKDAHQLVHQLRDIHQKLSTQGLQLKTLVHATTATMTQPFDAAAIPSSLKDNINISKLIADGQRFKFFCPLLRQLQQVQWSLQVYDAINMRMPFDHCFKLYITIQCCRAKQTKGLFQQGAGSMDVDCARTSDEQDSALGLVALQSSQTCTAQPSAVCARDCPSCGALRALLFPVENDIDAYTCPWLPCLEECIRRGREWLHDAAQLRQQMNDYKSTLRHTQAIVVDVDGGMASDKCDGDGSQPLPTVPYKAVQSLVDRACQCLTPSTSPDLALLLERLGASKQWSMKIQAWLQTGKMRMKMKQEQCTMSGNEDGLVDSNRSVSDKLMMRRHQLSRVMYDGCQTLLLSPELETLSKFEQLHQTWISKLDALFQPRHPKLKLRSLLKSLIVPITHEQDKEKVAAIMQERLQWNGIAPMTQRPVPDYNGLYCICKSTDGYYQSMLSCRSCGTWFHIDCVGVETSTLKQSRTSYTCPRCCAQKGETYPFGSIIYRHARPTLAACVSLYEWLNSELSSLCATELFKVDLVRTFRQLLARVDEFKLYIAPWITPNIKQENTTTASITNTQSLPAAPSSLSTGAITQPIAPAGIPGSASVAPPSPSPSPPSLAHLKGCIRQGKRLGIRLPELILLNKVYKARKRETEEAQRKEKNDVQPQTVVLAKPLNTFPYPLHATVIRNGDRAQEAIVVE